MSSHRRKKARRPERTEADHWAKAKSHLRCSFGCDITPGQWMRFGRRGSVVCDACARRHYQLEPPRPSFTFKKLAPEDVRARQAGGD